MKMQQTKQVKEIVFYIYLEERCDELHCHECRLGYHKKTIELEQNSLTQETMREIEAQGEVVGFREVTRFTDGTATGEDTWWKS